jgi:membrane dipeptidase
VGSLDFVDHRQDPAGWASALGCSTEACQLLLDADFIDLHLDLEVPVRVFGWRPDRHHGIDVRTRWWFGHTDYPRLLETGFTGVCYDIATNPFRPRGNRLATTLHNLDAATARIQAHPDHLALVVDRAGYDRARAAGRMAAWLTLQGGNALSADLSVLQGEVGQRLHRITLVHLTNSDLGGTNSPNGRNKGCTDLGRELVQRCNDAHVLVDLAHSSKQTFWDALDVHTADLPPIVSHTGVEGVRPHWRNVDDDQIRAIADRGGVVGIMYQSNFLAPVWTTCARSAIVDHLEHVIAVAGEDVPAIGTDYDGMITPPHDLADVTHHPLLVQDMLDRGWSETRIRKVLGLNYLRVVEAVRPGA